MNSLSRNGIIKLGGEKKKEKKPSTHPHKKKPKSNPSIFFTFSSPLCLDEGTGVEICWRLLPVWGTRYKGVCHDLPSTGHSWLQPALSQPQQQWKSPPGAKGRHPCSKALKKDTSHHEGLETASSRVGAPCHSPAQLRRWGGGGTICSPWAPHTTESGTPWGAVSWNYRKRTQSSRHPYMKQPGAAAPPVTSQGKCRWTEHNWWWKYTQCFLSS